jgi:hypothetical protein
MTHGRRARDSDVVHMSVRYRPSADVLVAQVDDVSDPAVQRDKPDADTVIEWVRRPDGSRRIVGLQVLFAAARTTQGCLSPSIPDALDARLRPIVRSLAGLDDTDFALPIPNSLGASPSPGDPLSRSDLNLEVPTDELELPSDLDDLALLSLHTLSNSIMNSEPVGASHAAGVARVLSDLANAIGDGANDADPAPTTRLTTVLRELASTIGASGGLASPGCSAAARVATRGGTPLTAGERTTLATLLGQLDNPGQWPDTIEGLQQLTDRLRGGGHQ